MTIKQLWRIALVIAALVGLALWLDRLRAQFGPHAFVSGYVIIGCVVFLAAYNLRKKLPFLPLGRSSTWLQLHIYVGWFTIGAFGYHVGWRWPNGWLESALFWVFAFTAASGVYGLVLSKVVPRRLARLREEVIYERIPALRLQVQAAAQDLMLGLVQTGDAPALADFYSEALIPYFVHPRGLLYYVHPSSRMRNRLQARLHGIERYLTQDQRVAQQQLGRLIDRRDDLDFHHAQQGRLKYWLFLHIGATYVLLLLAAVHAILAHAFWGGAG